MTTSHQTRFLSEIVGDEPVPPEKLSYFRGRLRNRLYDFIVGRFLEQERQQQLTRADLARRIGREPAQITRWLSSPGNWTLDTVSDLMLAISAAELDFSEASLRNRLPRNSVGPEWIHHPYNPPVAARPTLHARITHREPAATDVATGTNTNLVHWAANEHG